MAFIALLTLALLAAATFVAFRLGGAPERWAALTLCAMALADPVVHLFTEQGYDHVDLGHLGIDVLALASFGTLAVHALRFWPLWLAALQLIVLTAHVARWLDVEIDPRAYWLMDHMNAFGLFALVIGGSLLHARRKRANGSDPPWRTSSPRWIREMRSGFPKF